MQTSTIAKQDPGSFRDPAGHVFYEGDRIYRSITERGRSDYEFARDKGIIARLVEEGRLISSREQQRGLILGAEAGAYIIEHERIPFVSYPYEWSYEALRTAAVFHLELHIDLLDEGASLVDSSAYNVQFLGTRPIFIDLLSIRRYRDGELWAGHRQFCEQFLNPLLLTRYCEVDHQAWYRGALEGIPVEDTARLLPWRSMVNLAIGIHVHLQARLQRSARKPRPTAAVVNRHAIPKPALLKMLRQMLTLVHGLESPRARETVWANYENQHSYDPQEVTAKRAEVAKFVGAAPTALLLDIGCNRGFFSEAALEAGAKYVIGFDVDRAAIEIAFKRARDRRLAFLPLVLDAVNPSPNQGWAEAERKGLFSRVKSDAAVVLAFGHHMTIGKNVPIDQFTDWLAKLAPRVLYEFVPKSDPMLQKLLELREDIFPDYSLERFRESFGRWGTIERETQISSTGRRLIWIKRRQAF